MFGQEVDNDNGHICRYEAFAVHLDIFTILQSRNDAGIGGGSADAEFLQGLDQAGLREAWRWLGKVLFGTYFCECQHITLVDDRQRAVIVGSFHVILTFMIYRHEARLDEGGAGCAQPRRCRVDGRQQVKCNHVENGMYHLAGHGALPDQVV